MGRRQPARGSPSRLSRYGTSRILYSPQTKETHASASVIMLEALGRVINIKDQKSRFPFINIIHKIHFESILNCIVYLYSHIILGQYLKCFNWKIVVDSKCCVININVLTLRNTTEESPKRFGHLKPLPLITLFILTNYSTLN